MPIKLGSIVLYTTKELTRKLDITSVTLRTYIKRGRIKGQKVGGRWLVSEEAVREFFNTPHKQEAK